MKTKIIKLSIILIVFNLLNGCDWMYNTPVTGNVSLHKTKGDYRHLYMIRMSGDEIWAKNCWERDKTLWSGLNEDTIYTGRQKVVNGYVLDGPA
ncbi:MAG TPA: hypothetical protein DG754_09105, partial [Bacteroidales bacterium]|nr:hypothetical protein [Bacteroidales bacterium]